MSGAGAWVMATEATLRKRAGWPDRLSDCSGRMARSTRELGSHLATIPAGTLFELHSSTGWHRLDLRAEPCSHCGVRVHIGRVSWRDLEILREHRELAISDSMPADIRRLVIAARIAWQEGDAVGDATLRELDLALEAFADRVPWELD